MTNRRSIMWLSVSIAAMTVAHVMLSLNGNVKQALVRRRTLLESSVAEVRRVEVVRKGKLDMSVSRFGDWRIVEPFTGKADERAVKRLLDTLASCEVDPKSAMSDSELKRLKLQRSALALETPEVRITVSGDNFSEEIGFGRRTPDCGSVYVAFGDGDAVWTVPSAVCGAVDDAVGGFRTRDAFPVGPESVLSFSVKQGSGSFIRFEREGDAWRMVEPNKAVASSENVTEFLKVVMSASAKDFIWPVGAEGEGAVASTSMLSGYGLDTDSAVTVTLRCADGRDRQASFGNRASEGFAYALIHNSGAIVTVDDAALDMARNSASYFIDTRLFPQGMDGVSQISIADSGVTYLLEKASDGAWMLDAPVAAATDARSVETLLARIGELRTGDTATGDGVVISVSTNTPTVTVNRDAVLRGLRLSDLRSREIVHIDPLGVKRISVTENGAERPTSVCYDRDRREWLVEASDRRGMSAAATIEGILQSVSPLKAEWIVKLKVTASDLKAYGLETPRLTVAIDQLKENSVRRNILIGKAAQGGHFATIGSSDAVFVLSDETVRRLSAPLVTE